MDFTVGLKGGVNISWKDILKSNYTNVNDFQLFLSDVFNIPKEDSKNIKASQGLMQATSIGKFMNDITEQEFYRLMSLAEEKRYQELIDNLEKLKEKSVKQRKREYNQRPERRAYEKEYRQRPEVREKNIERDRKRYQKIKEKREKERKEYEASPEYARKKKQKEKERKEKERAYKRAYNQRPEVKERNRQRERTPEVRERKREYESRPEVKRIQTKILKNF